MELGLYTETALIITGCIFINALSYWLLTGAWKTGAWLYRHSSGNLKSNSKDKKDKRELMEELSQHRAILELNRVDNIVKNLRNDK